MQGNLRGLQSSLDDALRELSELELSDDALRELTELELSADAKAGSVVATIRTLVVQIGRAMGRQLAHEEVMMRQRESALEAGEKFAASGRGALSGGRESGKQHDHVSCSRRALLGP